MVQQHGDEIDSDREETRAKFQTLFRGIRHARLLCVALNDEHRPGRHFEPGKQRSRFFSTLHIELLQVLATQATVLLPQRADVQGSAIHFRSGARCSNESVNLWALEKTRRLTITIGVFRH